jgi:hypothetical protein
MNSNNGIGIPVKDLRSIDTFKNPNIDKKGIYVLWEPTMEKLDHASRGWVRYENSDIYFGKSTSKALRKRMLDNDNPDKASYADRWYHAILFPLEDLKPIELEYIERRLINSIEYNHKNRELINLRAYNDRPGPHPSCTAEQTREHINNFKKFKKVGESIPPENYPEKRFSQIMKNLEQFSKCADYVSWRIESEKFVRNSLEHNCH